MGQEVGEGLVEGGGEMDPISGKGGRDGFAENFVKGDKFC